MDELIPWLRRSGWAYLVVAAALIAVAWRMSDGGATQPSLPPEAGEVVGLTAPVDAPSRAAREGLVVHVTGAVRRPGVYTVPANSRVQRAVARAGGPTAKADTTAINLAAPLSDGQQVVMPRRLAGGATSGPSASTAGSGGPVSLSGASAEQLEALDGIGPTLAARIVDWRTAHGGFSSVDQLLEVRGIGPGRLEALRPQVVP